MSRRPLPLALAPGHLPETKPAPGRPLHALLSLSADFARVGWDAHDEAWARMPQAFAAFADGDRMAAARAATALVFHVQEPGPEQVIVPAGTRAGARVPAAILPDGSTAPAVDVVFATRESFVAVAGGIRTLHCVDPASDAVQLLEARREVTLFADWQPAPHHLYLGSDAMFTLQGDVEITLGFNFRAASERTAAPRPILTDWEYHTEAGWLPLELSRNQTGRFSSDGEIVLRKVCGPDAAPALIGGRKSFWIRGMVSARPLIAVLGSAGITDGAPSVTVSGTHDFTIGDVVSIDGERRARIVGQRGHDLLLDRSLEPVTQGAVLRLADPLPPLRPLGSDSAGLLAPLDTVRARIAMGLSGLTPANVLANTAKIDPTAAFHPFGQSPAVEPAFYVGDDAVFGQKGARISIDGPLLKPGKATGTLALSVEYFNGSQWTSLPGDAALSGVASFFTASNPLERTPISFRAPEDWASTEVGGTSALWLRIRVTGGTFAENRFQITETDNSGVKSYKVDPDPAGPVPPLLGGLTLSWAYQGARAPLDHVVTYNDFVHAERSREALWPLNPFAPFTPMSDTEPALHFGFAAFPPGALVTVHVAAPPGGARGLSRYAWEYRAVDGWRSLAADDGSGGFARSGLIRFVAPGDAMRFEGLGGALYRVRARVRDGVLPEPIALGGIHGNAMLAEHLPVERPVTLGSAGGVPGELVALDAGMAPLQAADCIEIGEWVGDEAAGRAALSDVPEAEIAIERNVGTRGGVRLWVAWRAVRTLALAGPDDRVFVADWVAGVLRFGDEVNGRVPPAAAVIRVVARSGGGLVGNLAAGHVNQLQSPLPSIDAVINPYPAGGGAEPEPLGRAARRSAARFRHRGRAITAADYEALAMEASPEVARVVCHPVTGAEGRVLPGFVTVVIVPQSLAAQPECSAELLDRVRDHLAAIAPWPVRQSLRVIAARYRPLGITARVIAAAEAVIGLERRLSDRLDRWLHPLGRMHGAGWPFGARITEERVAALLLAEPGVRHVAEVRIVAGNELVERCGHLEPDMLPAAGPHRLTVALEGGWPC